MEVLGGIYSNDSDNKIAELEAKLEELKDELKNLKFEHDQLAKAYWAEKLDYD